MSDTTIIDVPAFVLYDTILRQLDVDSRKNAELSCTAFRAPGQMMRKELITRIGNERAVSDLLSARGIITPDPSNPTEVAAFLRRTVRHIDSVNWTLPDALSSPHPAKVLVHESDFGTIERILTNGPEFTLKKKVVREIRASGNDVSIIVPASIVAGTIGLGYGAALGWKALNGKEITVGYVVGLWCGSMGALCDILIKGIQYPAAWKTASAFASRVAIGTLAAEAGQLATTASGAMISSTVVGAILLVALRRFERRFY